VGHGSSTGWCTLVRMQAGVLSARAWLAPELVAGLGHALQAWRRAAPVPAAAQGRARLATARVGGKHLTTRCNTAQHPCQSNALLTAGACTASESARTCVRHGRKEFVFVQGVTRSPAWLGPPMSPGTALPGGGPSPHVHAGGPAPNGDALQLPPELGRLLSALPPPQACPRAGACACKPAPHVSHRTAPAVVGCVAVGFGFSSTTVSDAAQLAARPVSGDTQMASAGSAAHLAASMPASNEHTGVHAHADRCMASV